MKTGLFTGRGEREFTPGSSGHRIGKYEVVKEIEASKRARVKVFHALDQDLGRLVTVKVVADANDKRLADRFRSDVARVAKLRVANVVAIYELGEQEGLPFAAMQHLGEDNLEAAIQSKSIVSLLQKMLLLQQLVAGAAEAHRAGLASIGLCPSGMALLKDGGLTIEDFGVVRLSNERRDAREAYMAPEEGNTGFLGDLLCDVFAFGIICYEFLTGSHPFREGEGAIDWQRKPVPLGNLLSSCPETLEQLVARSLEKERELRYPNFDEIRDELHPIIQGLKRSRAAELWAEGRRLLNAEKLEEAQGVVREALQLDPDDVNGQQVSSELRVLLQRQRTRGRIEDLRRQAEESAANRRFFAAVDILQAAARLDESDTETQSRLEKMRAQLALSVDATRLIGEARILMDQGELDQAQAKARKALDLDPEDPDAGEILKLIGETRERREREARAEEGIARAKSLALGRSFEEALAVLTDLWVEDPESPAILRCIDHVESQKKEAERQDRLQALTSQAGSLVSEERFAEAVALMERAEAEFPGDRALSELLGRAQEGLERTRVVDQTTTSSNQLCQEHRFDQARNVVDRALEALPGEPALLALRKKIEVQAQNYKRAATIQEAVEEVDWLIDQDRPDLAVRFLKVLCGSVADEPILTARLNDLEKGMAEWELRRFLDVVEEFSAVRGPGGEQRIQGAVLLPVLEEALQGTPVERLGKPAERLRNALREQATIAEVKHHLAAGNADEAERVFQTGLQFLSGEDTVASVKQEIEACRKYIGEQRTIQALVGQRRLSEAERILRRLAGTSRAEIQELSELVTELKEAIDEKVFCSRVRDTAQLLAGQGRVDDAERLFRKLSALFPEDATLEKERAALRAGTRAGGPKEGGSRPGGPKDAGQKRVEPRPEPAKPDRAAAAWTPPAEPAPRRVAAPKVAVISGVLLLISAGGAIWKGSRPPSSKAAAPAIPAGQVSQGPAARAAVPAATPVSNPTPPQETRLSSRVVVSTNTVARVSRREPDEELEPVTRRAFNAPARPIQGRDRAQSVDLPAPPTTTASLARETPGTLAIGQGLAGVLQPALPNSAAAETASLPVHRGVVEPARLLTAPVPRFPMLAAHNHVSGIVGLDAVIDKQGHVKQVTAVRGNPLLTPAARQAVLQWQYHPATVDGEPVEAKVEITMRFNGTE